VIADTQALRHLCAVNAHEHFGSNWCGPLTSIYFAVRDKSPFRWPLILAAEPALQKIFTRVPFVMDSVALPLWNIASCGSGAAANTNQVRLGFYATEAAFQEKVRILLGLARQQRPLPDCQNMELHERTP
jgi:hypothetical protein